MVLDLAHKNPVTGNLAVVAVFVKVMKSGKSISEQILFRAFPAEQMKGGRNKYNLDQSRRYSADSKEGTTLTRVRTGLHLLAHRGLGWIVMKEAVNASVQQISNFEARHEIECAPHTAAE
jgi:carbonic anhydrase